MRVMHISAKPLSKENLELTAELRCITDALLPGRARRDTRLDVVPQARPSDISFYLKMTPPDIVHYSGHGETEELFLCDEYFDEKPFRKDELVAALKGKGVRLVILNCCKSGGIADSLHKELGIVAIGSAETKNIPDETAVPFFGAFYRGLQVGMSVKDAFELAESESASVAGTYVVCGEGEGLVLLDAGSGVRKSDEPPQSQEESGPVDVQQRMLKSARQLGDIRTGVERERNSSWKKLGIVLALAIVASLIATWSGWSDDDIKGRLEAFEWFKVDFWALFVFFAFPPAVYLIESYWLRRPLTDAERSALQLAISPPPTEEPQTLAERLEAVVAEFETAKSKLGGSVGNE